jgi:hypothetical protein
MTQRYSRPRVFRDVKQMSRAESLGRRCRSRVLLAGLVGCLACSSGGASTGAAGTTGKTDGAAGAGAGGGGGGGQGGARDAGRDASAGGAAGASAADGGGVGVAVKGVIQDKEDVPIAGANARIGSTVVVADANGRFEIDGVVPPYDLDVWATTTPKSTYPIIAARYVGLTRLDPALHLFEYITPPHQATLNVTLSAPLPSNEVANCQFANPAGSEAMGQASGGVTQGSTFSLSVGWYTAATSISGTLSCLVYKGSAFNPTAFDTFASTTVTLNDGVAASATLTLTPVSTGRLMVGVTLGSATGVNVEGDILLPGGGIHPIGIVSPMTSNPTTVLVPQIAGTTLRLQAFDGFTSGADVYTERFGFPVSTASTQLTLPAPIAATSPADGVTMFDPGTPLVWSAPAGAAVNVIVDPNDVNNAAYDVYTAHSSATIPDLTAQGVPLPSGAAYGWAVVSFGASVSVDDIASPAGFHCNADLPGTCDWSETLSRTFTLR